MYILPNTHSGLIPTPRLMAMPPCGAANPGCSRLSAGSLRLTIRRFLPQQTHPKRSSFALLLPALLTLASTAFAQRPDLGQLDASPTLFTVMAAVNAAGYDAQIDSTNNHPLRKAVRDELAKKNIPSLVPLKAFFAKHPQIDPYISFAITCDGPPRFTINKKEIEVPPDVVPLEHLTPLLAAFYKEAGIEDLWQRSQPAINQYIDRYHRQVVDAVLQVNVYLRQQTSGLSRSRFQILLELLGAPNQVQMRSYGFLYTVVVTPSPEPRIFDVRHAYLHYLLDPLSTHWADILERKKGIGDHAFRSRTLSDSLKQDFLQLASESLIKAVEARLDHNPGSVQKSLLQGYILTPYFSEQLPVYEKQELDMGTYYKDMVQHIDVMTEEARLSKVVFDSELTPAHTVPAAAPPPPPLTGAAKTLKDADDAYDAHDLDTAKKLYLDVLQHADLKDMHAQAYYGLAHIAALQKDPETAQRLFLKTLELDPQQPQTKAYTLIYLGKLAAASGEAEQAVKYLQDALKVEGAPDKVRAEAQKTLAQIQKQ
jgi:tetratricopeptide (TPR) repeat protein